MYQLATPDAALARYIENYWQVSAQPDERVDLRVDVYVDARADLVFNFGAPYRRTPFGGPTEIVRETNFDAQRLFPITIEQSGAVDIVGVRFHVAGAAAFAKVPLGEATNRVLAPTEVFGNEISPLEAALEPLDLSSRSAALDRFFLAELKDDRNRDAFFRAVAIIESDPADTRLAQAASAAGLTERSLTRAFHRYLGFAPTTYRRIARFRNALADLMADDNALLAEVAVRHGYYDQAHLVRDFREFAGGPPRGYKGYFPREGPHDFAPNVVRFFQDDSDDAAIS